MVMIEGVSARGHEVPRQKLYNIWKEISFEPFPKVRAFQIRAKEFSEMLRQQKCLENDVREIKEWGRILSISGTDACVFNAEQQGDVDFIILIRNNPYHTLNEILVHELSHIASSDL